MNTLPYKIINFLIAIVWLVNGLYCKLLNYVPRHEQIVARILGNEYAGIITKLIGVSEILMAIWIVTGKWPRINTVLQILLIAVMNIIEYSFVKDLLLWGGYNIIYAFALIVLIYCNEFLLKKK